MLLSDDNCYYFNKHLYIIKSEQKNSTKRAKMLGPLLSRLPWWNDIFTENISLFH